MFSVTPFLRGYSNIDLVELRQASKRISRLKKHLDLDKVKSSDDKISKQILARIDEAEEEYTETKNRINQERIIYTPLILVLGVFQLILWLNYKIANYG